jgi:hypothetical protein
MNDIIKTKKRALNGKYYEYFFEVTKYLQSQNLSKYAFYKLRDKVIEDIYKAQQEGVPFDKIYKRGHEQHFQKRCEKLPKMGILEQISNVVMIFFVMFSVLAIFVYLYHLVVKVDSFYSEGVNLYISVDNLRNMVMYGFLGAITSTFLQKIDKKRKWIQASCITGVGLACLIALILVGNAITTNIKLNMLIIIPIFLVLALCGYFLTDILAKKKYDGKTNIEIEDK